ncbi:LppU/SCO3897 family protein [Saccharopolyspora sp. 5N708]|uniref:LppU/SCO3897 family protein n=1 Tax=Saccharopolyspora sp. 5N708 TaxID=3457424 RepID=UPI003FD19464
MRFPRPKRPPDMGTAGVLLLSALVLPLIVGLLAGVLGATAAGGGSSAKPTTPQPPEIDLSELPTTADYPTDYPDPGYPTSAATTTANEAHTAAVGECFQDYGSGSTSDFRTVSCGPGTYQLIERFEGVSAQSYCDGVEDTNWVVTYSDQVLCLEYQYADEAGNAAIGDCVYGEQADGTWYQYECEPGTFKVVDRYYGSTSTDRCDARQDYYRTSRWYTNPDQSQLDAVLCLTYQFADDSYYAAKGNCVVASGGEGNLRLYAAPDCDSANAVITGRTNEYNPEFCRDHGWRGWRDDRYSWVNYTVCWRRK